MNIWICTYAMPIDLRVIEVNFKNKNMQQNDIKIKQNKVLKYLIKIKLRESY